MTERMMLYRGYSISFDAKPIPHRGFDFDFAHLDYDGAPDGEDKRCGNGASVRDCQDQIDEIISVSEPEIVPYKFLMAIVGVPLV